MRITSRVAWHVRPGPRRDDPGPLVLPRPRGDPRYARGALRIADELQLLPPGRRALRPPAGLGFKALAVSGSLREEHRERLRDDPGPERDLPRSHGRRRNDPIGPGEGLRAHGADAPRVRCGLGPTARPAVLDLPRAHLAQARRLPRG